MWYGEDGDPNDDGPLAVNVRGTHLKLKSIALRCIDLSAMGPCRTKLRETGKPSISETELLNLILYCFL